MSNPALVLHDIYSEWREELTDQRSSLAAMMSLDTIDGARQIAVAAEALNRIHAILHSPAFGAKYKVAVFQRQYPEWWKPLVCYNSGWQTVIDADTFISPAHLDEIETFAAFLDGKVYELQPEASRALIEIVAEARRALIADIALSDPLRQYIHLLIQKIQNALDDETVGLNFDYAEAVAGLRTAFQAAASEGTDQSSVWDKLRYDILPNGAVNALISFGGIFTQLAIAAG